MIAPSQGPITTQEAEETLPLSEISVMFRPAVAQSGSAPAPVATAQRLPLTINRAANVATVNPEAIHLVDPRFILPHRFGQERAAFDLPTLVSTANPPTDALLFEAPRDPGKRFFAPQYVIATAPGSGPRQQWVALEATGTGCKLTVHLTENTPDRLRAGNAPIAPSTIRYFITATLQSREVNWDLTQVAAPSGNDLALKLELSTFADRDLLYAAMTDQAAQARLIIRRQVDLALPVFPPPTQYARTTTAIDTVVAFTFNKDLDANVFAGLPGGAGQLPGWNVCAVNWNGRRYTYYQATNQPTQVYFLPDAFKVGRQPTPPRRPSLAVAVSGADIASMQMTLSYSAVPVWNPQRISAAATELQKTLALQGPPSLALFQAANTALLLSLPGGDDGGGSSLAPQKDALIDLTAGVQGAITMGLAQFRQVYNALFDTRSALLSGEVQVTVGTDVAHIPFIARVADMDGDIVDIDVSVDTGNNVLKATLRNAIESPVHVQSIGGTIIHGDKPIASSVTATSAPVPVDLAPAGSQAAGTLTVTLSPATSDVLTNIAGSLLGDLLGGTKPTDTQVAGALGDLAGQLLDSSCTARLDLGNITVVPDPQATWRTIIADGGAGPLSRAVTLKFVAAMLTKLAAPPLPAPADMIMAVQVVFENGQTATFDASQAPDAAGFLDQVVKLSVPIAAFVLGNAPIDSYRYRTDVITGAGIRTGAWVTDNRDTIFVVPG